MAEESFKERVQLKTIKAAKKYKEIYVDYEYLIYSEMACWQKKTLKKQSDLYFLYKLFAKKKRLKCVKLHEKA